MQIVLVGNPNSGKTSLFNLLTGARQHVGNWPGVTVEKKQGLLTVGDKQIEIIDLPGIYSLDPDSVEQKLTRDYIYNEKPDVIINILDSVNLERNLFLTLQLRESGIPMVVLLNMADEIKKAGIQIDTEKLSRMLGVPASFISASKGTGMDEFHAILKDVLVKKIDFLPFCGGCSSCTKCSAGEFRYQFIDTIIAGCVTKTQGENKTFQPDRILLNRFLALPIFLLIMFGIFTFTFGEPIQFISGQIETLLEWLSGSVHSAMTSAGAPAPLISLVCDGMIAGIGTVLIFLPQITVLFLLMSLLEDSGYMSRAAFIMDKLFSMLGLTGSSFIPLLMGFGCGVPALMACRILPSEKDRKLTMMLTTFMSCSARLPMYLLLVGVFFQKNQGFIIFVLYFLGIFVAMLSAFILSKTVFKKENSAFVIEIPPYRLPKGKNLLLHAFENVKEFVIRAGTMLFVASIILWVMNSFTSGFVYTTDADKSLLASFGSIIAPIFAPLGFGSWQAATALLTGVAAKEMVVSTFSVLSGTSGQTEGLNSFIAGHFTSLTAFVFMCFALLYMPCLSAIVTMRREFNSWKWTAGSLIFSFGVAYLVSFIIYLGGRMLGF